MPLVSTQVIPAGWSDHHRPTATSSMTATCVITRNPGSGTTDTAGDWTPAAPATVYDGPCRVQALGDERAQVTGETLSTARRYLVPIRYDAATVLVDDTIEITGADDADLVGRQLHVVAVQHGSEQWERDLIAEEVEP